MSELTTFQSFLEEFEKRNNELSLLNERITLLSDLNHKLSLHDKLDSVYLSNDFHKEYVNNYSEDVQSKTESIPDWLTEFVSLQSQSLSDDLKKLNVDESASGNLTASLRSRMLSSLQTIFGAKLCTKCAGLSGENTRIFTTDTIVSCTPNPSTSPGLVSSTESTSTPQVVCLNDLESQISNLVLPNFPSAQSNGVPAQASSTDLLLALRLKHLSRVNSRHRLLHPTSAAQPTSPSQRSSLLRGLNTRLAAEGGRSLVICPCGTSNCPLPASKQNLLANDSSVRHGFQRLVAAFRGSITRRLFATERVLGIITTIKDTAQLILSLYMEQLDSVENVKDFYGSSLNASLSGSLSREDRRLESRLRNQLRAALRRLHEVFEWPTSQQLQLLASSHVGHTKQQETDEHFGETLPRNMLSTAVSRPLRNEEQSPFQLVTSPYEVRQVGRASAKGVSTTSQNHSRCSLSSRQPCLQLEHRDSHLASRPKVSPNLAPGRTKTTGLRRKVSIMPSAAQRKSSSQGRILQRPTFQPSSRYHSVAPVSDLVGGPNAVPTSCEDFATTQAAPECGSRDAVLTTAQLMRHQKPLLQPAEPKCGLWECGDNYNFLRIQAPKESALFVKSTSNRTTAVEVNVANNLDCCSDLETSSRGLVKAGDSLGWSHSPSESAAFKKEEVQAFPVAQTPTAALVTVITADLPSSKGWTQQLTEPPLRSTWSMESCSLALPSEPVVCQFDTGWGLEG